MAVINVPHPGPFPSLKQGFAVRLRLASDSPPSCLSCVGAQGQDHTSTPGHGVYILWETYDFNMTPLFNFL